MVRKTVLGVAMQVIINKKLIRRMTEVIGVDWPLSLGYRLYVVSNSRYARNEIRLPKKRMKELLNGNSCDGFHAVWDNIRTVVIIVNPVTGDTKVRVCELVAHEVSHAVDGYLARAAVEHVDTELRAYLIDWMVGKILHRFKV